jgi:very-short-patch-repair endonuclease
MTKITTESIIARFKDKHGDTYDYSKVKYVSAKTKVTVLCKDHGEFYVTPNNHSNGTKCPKCSGRGLTTKDIVARFITKHNDRYIYDKVVYKGSNKKVIVTCKEHGDFLITPNNHTSGHGCPNCANKSRSSKQLGNTNDFIEKAIKVHGYKYDYSLVDYLGAHKKVTIICKDHGNFYITPANHWSNKVGCPTCKNKKPSKGEQKIIDWLEAENISYECQKTFVDLYYKSKNAKLKYDFYLPEFNMLIEYDGEYHFKPISFGKHISGEEQLAITKLRDKIKDEYAETNNYRMLRIPYNSNVEEELEKTLIRGVLK